MCGACCVVVVACGRAAPWRELVAACRRRAELSVGEPGQKRRCALAAKGRAWLCGCAGALLVVGLLARVSRPAATAPSERHQQPQPRAFLVLPAGVAAHTPHTTRAHTAHHPGPSLPHGCSGAATRWQLHSGCLKSWACDPSRCARDGVRCVCVCVLGVLTVCVCACVVWLCARWVGSLAGSRQCGAAASRCAQSSSVATRRLSRTALEPSHRTYAAAMRWLAAMRLLLAARWRAHCAACMPRGRVASAPGLGWCDASHVGVLLLPGCRHPHRAPAVQGHARLPCSCCTCMPEC
jgi:hypothetical protein